MKVKDAIAKLEMYSDDANVIMDFFSEDDMQDVLQAVSIEQEKELSLLSPEELHKVVVQCENSQRGYVNYETLERAIKYVVKDRLRERCPKCGSTHLFTDEYDVSLINPHKIMICEPCLYKWTVHFKVV